MTDYITLDLLKQDHIGKWNCDLDTWAARQISKASSFLRSHFKAAGRDLDLEIEAGTLDRLTVESVVSQLVLTKLSASMLPMGGDFAQATEQAGSYSFSFTANPQANSFRLRGDMLMELGFKTSGFTSIPIEL